LTWSLKAVEIKETKKPTLLDVGVWDAIHGLIVYDDLFPHFTGGLRQRVINVTTMEVFGYVIMNSFMYKFVNVKNMGTYKHDFMLK
jgi:hypothetical protein